MERRIDVSMLEPCEPMERTLEAIRRLGPGDYLRVMHRREPTPLFPLLEQAGFHWLCGPGQESAVEVLIWRMGDDIAARGAKARFDGR